MHCVVFNTKTSFFLVNLFCQCPLTEFISHLAKHQYANSNTKIMIYWLAVWKLKLGIWEFATKWLRTLTFFFTSGHQSHSSYHGSPAHKECETHYKSIYKTVYEHKDIKKCHDIPKKICEHLKEKVLCLSIYFWILFSSLPHCVQIEA